MAYAMDHEPIRSKSLLRVAASQRSSTKDAFALRVIIAGGGTGGHLFPGIALLDELRRRIPSTQALFVGTARGIEARVIPARKERLALLKIEGFANRSLGAKLKSLFLVPFSLVQACLILLREKPDCVIGLGGFASLPILMAANLFAVPTFVIEPNSFVGLTNRWMGRWAKRVYVAFADAERFFGSKALRTGNPLRADIVRCAQKAAMDPIGFESRATTILVLGGSQGARSLNEAVPLALGEALNGRKVSVMHQTGVNDVERVRALYTSVGLDATVVSFIENMAEAYAQAALVIARAGASTVTELCAIGRPSILVPFPFAADDHQRKNAHGLHRENAASVVENAENINELSREIKKYVDSADARSITAAAARALGRPDAARAIVDDMFDVLSGATPTMARTSRAQL